MVKPQTQQILEQLESQPLRELLSQLLDGQEQIQEKLNSIDDLQEKQQQIQEKLNDIETEVKAWGGWLRTASGTVLFVVSISFISAFFGLLLPIALNLWKNTI